MLGAISFLIFCSKGMFMPQKRGSGQYLNDAVTKIGPFVYMELIQLLTVALPDFQPSPLLEGN